jgi:hypothetical protein
MQKFDNVYITSDLFSHIGNFKISRRDIVNIKYVFCFSSQLLCKPFSTLITSWQDMHRNTCRYRAIWLFLDSVHRLVCGSFTKDHNVLETGSVSILRWMGQGRPTQLGPSERASLSHLIQITDPVSETLWSFVKLPHTRRWTESKRSQIVLYNIHHRQNPFKSIHM